MTEEHRTDARTRICQVVADRLAALALPTGSVVAGYLPLRTEPGSLELLGLLDRLGLRVIVPVTLPDRDLDWVRWQPGQRPDGSPRLGLDAIAGAAMVLVPAFAVDVGGGRLGRGGGSYDRALARVRAGAEVAALLFTGELLPAVPTDAWDRPVSAAITPDGWHAVGRGSAGG